jgi:hypothetical protein
VEWPDNSAAEFLADLEPRGQISTKLFTSSYPLYNSREVSKKYCYFPTHTDKNSVFLNPKLLQNWNITGDQIFCLSGRVFLL